MARKKPKMVGIIGGSGLYDIEGFDNRKEVRVKTPFGDPSDSIITGTIDGRPVAFLPRHGRGHRILPTEVNSRANMYALKKLGVEIIIAISATGSMKEKIKPRDFVIVDQVFDRTRLRPNTFFGDGVVAHISFDEPYCPSLRKALIKACKSIKIRHHTKGTYVCIEGPSFSTRAESRIYRSWGVDVIGMTNLPEAKLAREAELCYATVALVTDYDVWKTGEEVTVERVIANLNANVKNVKKLIKRVLSLIDDNAQCNCTSALRNAIMTEKKKIPPKTLRKLQLLIGKYL